MPIKQKLTHSGVTFLAFLQAAEVIFQTIQTLEMQVGGPLQNYYYKRRHNEKSTLQQTYDVSRTTLYGR